MKILAVLSLVLILLTACKKEETQEIKDVLCSHNWVRMEVTPTGTLADSIYYSLKIIHQIRFNKDNSCEFVYSFGENEPLDTVITVYSLDESLNRISFPDIIKETTMILVDTSLVRIYLSPWNIAKLNDNYFYIRTDFAQKSTQQDTLYGFIDPIKQYFVAQD